MFYFTTGLVRTCEIFTAQGLALANLQDTQSKEFSTLSMSAEKHVNIIEVSSGNMSSEILSHSLILYIMFNKIKK